MPSVFLIKDLSATLLIGYSSGHIIKTTHFSQLPIAGQNQNQNKTILKEEEEEEKK